jgi:hypothetical protein
MPDSICTNRAGERGGVDLIQFIVAVLIISIAAATAAFSIYIGRGALDTEWRKKRALEIARDEVEYWSGLIYEGVSGMAVPLALKNATIEREMVLDPRGDDANDDIYCNVVREPLELNLVQPGVNDIENYLIKVHVIWQEPSDNPTITFPPDTVSLQAWMIYRNSISGGGSTGGTSGGT